MNKKPAKAVQRRKPEKSPARHRANENKKPRILAAIVEVSAEAIISTCPDGNILTWNQGAEKLFGYTADEAMGQPLAKLAPVHGMPDDITIPSSVKRADGSYQHEAVCQRKDGTLVAVLMSVSQLRNSKGEVIGSATIARDFSDRKKVEAALREAKDRLANQASELEQLAAERTAALTEANKHLEAFVYSIAHDLRAPLRSMQGFSTLLVQEFGPALNERGRDFAQRIAKSAQFMDALLKDMLAFSNISQQRVQLARVNLDPILQAVVSRLEQEIRERKAVVDLKGPWPRVLAHESTLAQVAINLIGNGLKFVPAEVVPRVTVRTETQGEFVRVWVEDNGIGIAPEHQDQIFKLFIRLAGETYPGTGLGLAIVQKGIEKMGGKVGVQSTVGQGSRFWFELKAA